MRHTTFKHTRRWLTTICTWLILPCIVACVCGDGSRQFGEDCDDGNEITEACAYGEESCTICNFKCKSREGVTSYCGDGRIDSSNGEQCDDGDQAQDPCLYGVTSCTVCSSSCREVTGETSFCGDGRVDQLEGEQCDNGSQNGQACAPGATGCVPCSSSCTLETVDTCGDGVVDTQNGETCDDGNRVTEACAYGEAGCTVCNTACQSVSGETQRCGDGVRQSAFEQCDDGNTVTESCAYGDNDCTICDASCTTVNGVERYCGDGLVEPAEGEACDDGNTVTEACAYGASSCTVCSSTCQEVSGATRSCGDGNLDAGFEQCDDGNNIDNDACPNNCRFTNCGDGVIQPGEACDDGNNTTEACAYGETSCTVCNANCQNESGATSYCGDRQTDTSSGEQCDDGNTVTTDACTNTCQDAVCGDGIVRAGRELCDDGNTDIEACDYGEESCTVCGPACVPVPGASVAYCGDGVVQSGDGETCDDGNTESERCDYGAASCIVCASNCQDGPGDVSYCGDGTIDSADGESCDDGNAVTEACAYGLESCTVCTGSCTEGPGVVTYCGDGVLQTDRGEACDDGNDDANDGCVNCAVVSCGDGVLQDGESCDDGNSVTEDCAYGEESCTVCTNQCVYGPGAVSFCGDGARDESNGEACDDGNDVIELCSYGETACFACNSACEKVPGYTSYCGDGILDWTDGEQCDDGNNDDGDYCEAACLRTTGWCGDGLVQLNEVCDDANTNDGDYCAGDCQLRTGKCGDGTLQAIEVCDDGNSADGDYCNASCTEATGSCGDGAVQTNEACDDGNTSEGDYCSSDCASVTGTCGDGITQSNELCDDGNTTAGDYCASDCLAITGRCGDGVVQLGEACDDGNQADGDLCSSDCSQSAGNLAPVATGEDGLSVAANGCLVTQLSASDLNGDVLTYAITSGPEGASIDAATGTLSFYPTLSQVGTQTVDISVSDGGLSTAVSLTVEVVAVSNEDLIGPRVRLRAPVVAPRSSTVVAEALVEDTSAVATVEFMIGAQVAATLTSAPYTYSFLTLDAVGPVMPLSVRATDAAGNATTVSQAITVVEAHTSDLPTLDSFRRPSQVVAGTDVLLGVEASAASGIDSVTFVKDGQVLATSSTAPFGASVSIPSDAALGAWPLTVEVRDFAGNVLTQVETLTVVASVTDGPVAEPSVLAPGRALPTQTLPFEINASDAAQVIVRVEGVVQGESYGDTLSGTVALGTARSAGQTVRLETQVTYDDGSTSERFACVALVDRLGGIARGTALDDTHGRGIADVSLTLRDGLGQDTTLLSDGQGHYQSELSAGEYTLLAEAAGYLGMTRRLTIRPDAVTRIPDLRLTPENDASTIPGIGEVTLDDGAWSLTIPSAALGRFTELSVTDLSAQAMPALTPLGYGVVAAVQLGELDGLSTGTFTLTVEAEAEPSLLLAHYDATTAQWLKLSSAASGMMYSATVASTGLYALLRPDVSPLAPAPVDVGEALEAVAAASLPANVQGDLVPSSAALSISLLETQPSVSIDATLQAAEGVSSGAVVQLEVSESYSFVDGSDLTPQPVLRDVTLSQAVSEGVARGSLNLSPSQPLDTSAFTGGTISIRGVAEHATTINGLVDTQAGQLEAGGHVFLYEAGTFDDVGTLAIRVLSEPDASESEPGLFDVVGGFVLEGLAPSSALELIYHAPGEAIDAEHALVRRVRDGNRTAFALVDIGSLEGAKVRFNATYDTEPLPGIARLGDYRILRLNAPWRLVSGTIEFGTADLEDAWVVGRANDWPLLGAATTDATRFALLVHPHVAEITATSLARGYQATASLDAGSAPSVQTLTLVPSPPTLVSSSPAQDVTGAPVSGSLALTFSQRLADGELPADALTLHGPSGSLSATLSRLGDGKTVLLKPDVALSDLTAYTVRGSAGVTDIYGQALAVPDGSTDIELLSFTTGDFTPPQVQQPDDIIVSIPDDGQSTAVGGPGSVDAGTLVVFRNNTTGELVTVEANEDGSFNVTGNAELGDDIDLLFIDASGNETEFEPENFENLDGTKLVGPTGDTLEAEGERQLVIPEGAVAADTQLRVEALPESRFEDHLLDQHAFVDGFQITMDGIMDTAAEEFDYSAPLPTDRTWSGDERLLVYRKVAYGGRTYLYLVEEAKVVGDRFETQSPPFEGVKEAGEYTVVEATGLIEGTATIPADPGVRGVVIIESGDQATYAEWKAFEPFVFAIPEGQSVRFRVMDTVGREVYVSDGYLLESSDLNASIQLPPALFGQIADFALVGMSPANGSVDVSTRSPIILRFSDEIDRSRPIDIVVEANGLEVAMNPRVEYDRFGLATLVTLYRSDAPFEPDATYTITIGTVYDVEGRLYSDNRLLQFTTGVGTDDSYNPDADGLYDPTDLDDRLAEIEALFAGAFEPVEGTPEIFAYTPPNQREWMQDLPTANDQEADIVQPHEPIRIRFTHPLSAIKDHVICVRGEITAEEASNGRTGFQPLGELVAGIEPTDSGCLRIGTSIVASETGRYDTLVIYPDYQFESGRKYTVQLVEIFNARDAVYSNVANVVEFYVFAPYMFDALDFDLPISDIAVFGRNRLAVSLSDRSFANEGFRVNDGGVGVINMSQEGYFDLDRRAWFSQGEEDRGSWYRSTAGYLPVLKVRKDGSLLFPASSWYHANVLRAYDVTSSGQLARLWSQQLTAMPIEMSGSVDASYWYDFSSVAGGTYVEFGYQGYAQNFDTVDFSNSDRFISRYNVNTPNGRRWVESRSDAYEYVDPIMLNPMIGLATDIATVDYVSEALNEEEALEAEGLQSACRQRSDQVACSEHAECLWSVAHGGCFALSSLSSGDSTVRSCRLQPTQGTCSGDNGCFWSEARGGCYALAGSDHDTYIATIGVGIERIPRHLKGDVPDPEYNTPPAEEPDDDVVDLFHCPGCMTVEAYEDKVLAGDGQQLYLLSRDLSIQEVFTGVAAKDIYVAEDFAIQHHGDGLFDLAFVVEPFGKVSLFTEKMVEMSEFSLDGDSDRFGRVGEFFLPKELDATGAEYTPSINDMAFDVRRQRAYIATDSNVYVVDLAKLVSSYCNLDETAAGARVFPVVDQFPLFGSDSRYQWFSSGDQDEATSLQNEYSKITLSPLGHFLYVGDGEDTTGQVDRSPSHLFSIALTVDAIDEPELTTRLDNRKLGFMGACERLIETRKQYEATKSYYEANQSDPNLFTDAQLAMLGGTNESAIQTVLDSAEMGIKISGRALAEGLRSVTEMLGPTGRMAFEKVGEVYDATNSAAQEIIDVAAALGELTGIDEVQGDVAELTQIAFDYDESDFWSSFGRNVLSFAINFTPLGTAKDIFDAIIGFDSLTGDKLDPFERVLNIALVWMPPPLKRFTKAGFTAGLTALKKGRALADPKLKRVLSKLGNLKSRFTEIWESTKLSKIVSRARRSDLPAGRLDQIFEGLVTARQRVLASIDTTISTRMNGIRNTMRDAAQNVLFMPSRKQMAAFLKREYYPELTMREILEGPPDMETLPKYLEVKEGYIKQAQEKAAALETEFRKRRAQIENANRVSKEVVARGFVRLAKTGPEVLSDLRAKAEMPEWLLRLWIDNPALDGFMAAIRTGNKAGIRFMSQYHLFSQRYAPKPEACKFKSTKAVDGQDVPGGLVAIHAPSDMKIDTIGDIQDVNQQRFMQTVVNNLGETLGAAMDATCAAKGEKSPCKILTDAEIAFFKRKMTSIDDGDAIGIPDGAFDGLVDKLRAEAAFGAPESFDSEVIGKLASLDFKNSLSIQKVQNLLGGGNDELLQSSFELALRKMEHEGLQVQVSATYMAGLAETHPLKRLARSEADNPAIGTHRSAIRELEADEVDSSYYSFEASAAEKEAVNGEIELDFDFNRYKDNQAFVVRRPIGDQKQGALLGPDVDSAAFAKDGKMVQFRDDDSGNGLSAQTLEVDQIDTTRQVYLAEKGLDWELPFSPDILEKLGQIPPSQWKSRFPDPTTNVDLPTLRLNADMIDRKVMENNFSKLPASQRANVKKEFDATLATIRNLDPKQQHEAMVRLLRQNSLFQHGSHLGYSKVYSGRAGVNRGTSAAGGVFTLKRVDGVVTSHRIDQEVVDTMNKALDANDTSLDSKFAGADITPDEALRAVLEPDIEAINLHIPNNQLNNPEGLTSKLQEPPRSEGDQ